MEEVPELKVTALRNQKGTLLEILNYGASIFSFTIKDKLGERQNMIVGPKDPETYITQEYHDLNKCFGASIGRFAGRISNGCFSLDGKEYQLYEKDDVHLHGGAYGFQYKFWEIEQEKHGENPSVKLSYLSKDGEENYPGNLKVTVLYTLTEADEILIEYKATTDQKTVINLTNHAYFNLNGNGSIGDHFLKITAGKILEVDEKTLPTGDLMNLNGHPKDFRENKLIGNRPLDDTYVLDAEEDEVAAQIFAPLTGIKMFVKTNQNALIAYVPENLPTSINYTSKISEQYPSFCLEASNFPDAPNFRNFPTSVLEPGQVYYNKISFRFQIKN